MATTEVDADAPLPVRTMLHLIATVDDDSVEFLDGQPVPQAFLDSLDPRTADVVGHVFSGAGKPLWTGRRHRLATVHQWPALIARDRACVDCGADVAFTEAHHPHEWGHHGLNDIDNLELKCHTDHALAHRGSRGERRSRPRAA
ncbi:MAG: HNH endonuclease signature motif containing protein [Actinomycetota bacterium]